MHLTAFGKHLNDDQLRIKRYGITISNKDKLQFYLKKMYSSNHFDKKEMTEWENKPEADKNNFGKTKTYFEGLVKDYEIYKQNSGGTVGKNNYKSANQTTNANSSGELRKYIAGIAQAAVAQEEQAANIRDSTKALTDAMVTQIKTLADQIAALTKAMANKENIPNGSGKGSSGGRGGGGGGGGSGGGKGQAKMQHSPIHQTAMHGWLLFVPWLPSSRREPHKCHLPMEAGQPRCDSHLGR
jgi:hypothetical protein